jgi:hypothetical protein
MQITRLNYLRPPFRSTPWILSGLLSIAWGLAAVPATHGRDDAVVRGKIEYDETRAESWDGNRLVVPFPEIIAKLRQRITYPPPYPQEFSSWNPEQKLDWERKFIESEAGKKFLEKRNKLFAEADEFDIKFEEDGSFVVYDVPSGVYGIQGRVDKEIGGTQYGFEVFGQIEILKDVDELILGPMRVEVTPMMAVDQAAPPIAVKTHDDAAVLSLDTYQGHKHLFVNFWTSVSPSAAREQKLVQEMYEALKDKYDLKLLSINVDVDRKTALDFIVNNGLKSGSHGFTDGLDHRTLFDFGVRSLPSFWLLDGDGKILMTQYEVAQAMRVKPSMTQIISDRIDGKDAPTPAASVK